MKEKEEKFFTVSVDGDEFEIPRKGVTPNDILRIAQLDPASRYLIEKQGNKIISYQDNADVELKHLHQNMVL